MSEENRGIVRQNKIWLQSTGFSVAVAGHLVADSKSDGNPIERVSITLMCYEGGFIPLSDYERALSIIQDEGNVLYESRNHHVIIEGVATANDKGLRETVMSATIRYRDRQGEDQEKSIIITNDVIREIQRKVADMKAVMIDYEHVARPSQTTSAPPPPEEACESEK
jgi:hypothetical protein